MMMPISAPAPIPARPGAVVPRLMSRARAGTDTHLPRMSSQATLARPSAK